MESKKTDKIWKFCKDNYVYVVTFGIAFLIMSGAWIIGRVGPFGGKCLVVVDGVHQYLPFFSEYQEKLKTFGSLQYTYDVGLGNNFLSLWSYYLSSPFNLIIILFGKSQLPMILNIIISLKVILAALTFAYFLRHAGKKPEKNPGIVVFSLFYAFSSYVVGYYWNLMWLDCIYVFPLIILGMQKMMNQKDSRLYVLTLLYSFICNYYISFMICLFLVLWFFTFHFKSFTDFFARGLRFAIASLTTAAMSAVVLLPAYKGIMTTASAKFALPDWKFYGKFADTLRSALFCSEVTTNQINDAGTNLYCGIFTVMLAIMFLFIKNVSLERKIKYFCILVFLIVSCNNQLLNYIWHGFHNQYGIPNRFVFLYIFVLIIMAYKVYLERKHIRIYMVVLSYLASMLFVIYCYFNAEITYEIKTYVCSVFLLTVYLVLFAMYIRMPEGKYIPRYMMLAIAVLEVVTNALFGFSQVGSSEPDYYYGDTYKFDALKEKVKEEEGENGFYRSDILIPKLVDEATWHNLKSVGIFGSTVRGELVTTMGQLGFYTGANEYLYYGATPVTNALFGVKYVYTRENDFNNLSMDLFATDEDVSVYQNQRTLPVGYMVKDDILKFEPGTNGPFTVQNELSGALTGVEPIFATIYEDMDASSYGTNIKFTQVSDNMVSYSDANGSARVDMLYTIPRDMDLYMNCRGSNVHKIALLIDGTEVAYDRYQGQIFHIGNLKEGQQVDIQFELNDGKDLSGELYCYPMEFVESQFEGFYNILRNQSMDVTKCTDTKIEGTLTVNQDGVFMTSIPYDEGWTLYANGKKVETCRILDSFVGAKLPKGEYDIRLVYHCSGLLTGFVTTMIGVLCFGLICVVERKMRKKKDLKKQNV